MKDSRYTLLTACLGVVIGVLATMIVLRKPQKEQVVKFDGAYSDWRKLNLILQQVQ